jgi:hypothetical protein
MQATAVGLDRDLVSMCFGLFGERAMRHGGRCKAQVQGAIVIAQGRRKSEASEIDLPAKRLEAEALARYSEAMKQKRRRGGVSFFCLL